MYSNLKKLLQIIGSTHHDITYKRQCLAQILSLSQFIFAFSFTIYFTFTDQNYVFAAFLTPFILMLLLPTFWKSQFGPFNWSIYVYIFSSFVSIISVDTYLGPETNAHLLAFLIFITSLLVLGAESKGFIFFTFILTVLAFLSPIVNSYTPFVRTISMDASTIKVIRFALETTIFFLLTLKLYLLKILLDAETQKVQIKSDQASVELDKKQYLLKILSHDIKSPIANSLRGVDSLISEKSDLTKSLLTIKNSQLAVKEMIDNISSYNFDMITEENLTMKVVTLAEIFARLNPLVESRLSSKNIKMQLEGEMYLNTSLVLNSDTFVYQVMGNIISNSIKFSDENTNLNIKLDKNSSHLILSVQDEGVGIPPEALRNQKFTTKGTWGEKGTGIGLEIIRKFCDLNKIKISFKSRRTDPDYEGSGTQTILFIPLGY